MRLIDADALCRTINKIKCPQGACMQDGLAEAFQAVMDAPTIEAELVRYGHWEWFEEWNPSTPDHPRECEECGWRCSECKAALENVVGGYWDNPDEEPELPYCPNCGAKMDEEDADGLHN